MKRFYLFFVLILCLAGVQAQRFVQYSTDSSRIKYASFLESENRDMSPEAFFTSFLQLDPQNRFIPSDTFYSPDSAYTYIKYRQQYAGYEVEGAMVTLTYHHHSIIRFNGYYVPANNLLLRNTYSDEDAINAFKQHYNSQNDSCHYYVTKKVAYNPSTNQARLCFQIQCSDPTLYNKILYVSTDDLSIFNENDMPGAGFNTNATFYTQYNGVRNGYNTYLPWTPPAYILRDPNAAVQILKLNPNVTNLEPTLSNGANTYYNSSNIWNDSVNNIYPNYVLDAYWAASEYSNYMQNTHNVNKGVFQRYDKLGQTVIDDTITSIIIANNTYVGNTFWTRVRYSPNTKENNKPAYNNVIVIGAPDAAYNPKASIDEVVHEFAHIFSFQNWYHVSIFPPSSDDALAEACADIWAAIITSKIYPNA